MFDGDVSLPENGTEGTEVSARAPEPPVEAVTGEPVGSVRAGWRAVAPGPGAPELADEQIPIPLEPPRITELRHAKGGPYLLAPDSAEPVPPEMWNGLDDLVVYEQAQQIEQRLADPHARHLPARLMCARERGALKSGGPAARRLLDTLDRGLEATTRELDAAIEAQLRDQGLQ